MMTQGNALDHRDHRKLTIVDGRLAFLGGINISGVYGSLDGSSLGSSSDAYRSGRGMGGSGNLGGSARGKAGDDLPFEQRPWRDTQVRIEGPVVADLQRAFLKQWEKQKKETLPEDKQLFPDLKPQGPHVVRAIAGSPSDSDKGLNAFYLTLISAIESAETEVRITNAYFVPHQELLKALEDAAKRGVDVQLILPSRTDSWLVFHAGRSYYEELLEAGVKIYERKTRLLHAKTAVIDGVWSTVGSTNLDWRSLLHNDELNAVVLGTEFAAQMNAIFQKDLANSGEITLADWHARPIQERLKEACARAWSRFL
jgi:cardiolipin synthase A/B